MRFDRDDAKQASRRGCFAGDHNVNVALLSLRENGTYQQLYSKWFGGP